MKNQITLLIVASLVQGAVYAAEFVDGRMPNTAKVALGKQLFFDKILSGNQNISCATCHHVLTDTGDGLSLPIGEGGNGLGVTRDTGIGRDAVHARVPRNAPPVFMLGSTEVRRIYHDGRVELNADFPSGFRTPAGMDLPDDLENLLAAQAMFPVQSATEMAGQVGENPVADAVAMGDLAGPNGVWAQLAARVAGVPGYVSQMGAVYGVGAQDITFSHVANAIAAFEVAAWRADRSRYDAFLAKDMSALSNSERNGERLFFGKAGCGNCHSGELLSDMEFHAIGMPQIGPGKGNGIWGYEDWGRYLVTQNPADMFKFRTPPLRNVALTAPYGHAGAYDTLEEVVRHHLDPITELYNYDCEAEIVVPSRPDLDLQDCLAMNDASAVSAIAAANELQPVVLTDDEFSDLIDFLHALTDTRSVDLRADMPRSTPSGLSVIE